MNTESVIKELVTRCEPIKPLESPTIRFSKWALAAVFLLFLGVVVLRPPQEIWNRVGEPSFVFTAVVMLGLAMICSFSAFTLTVPDHRNRRFDLIPMGTVLASFLLVAFGLLTSDITDSHPSYVCVLRIVGLSIAPGALLFQMLRKAAPLKPGFIGLLAVLGSLAFSEIGVQFVCLKSAGSHVLVWHILPICVLGSAGFWLGQLTLKR